jgi:hypothetical protein
MKEADNQIRRMSNISGSVKPDLWGRERGGRPAASMKQK